MMQYIAVFKIIIDFNLIKMGDAYYLSFNIIYCINYIEVQ